MRALIVHNIKSGFGSDAIFEFERLLVRVGDECVLRVLPPTDSEEAFERAAHTVLADAEAFDVVVLSGGDGTIATLLWELREREIPTCIFPSGTANLFFANIGNAMEPQAIARACRAHKVVKTDLAQISWHTPSGKESVRGSCLMSGFGFDAQLMLAALPNKRALGEAAYFTAALQNTHPTVRHFTITCDDTTYERDGIACIVANNAMMQGEIEIVSNCSMSDGVLDVIVLATTDAVHLLRPIFAGLVDKSGRALGRPYIEHFTGKHIVVKAPQPLPMQIDGEVIEGEVDTYEVQVLPHSCSVVVDATSRYQPADGPVVEDPEQAFPDE